MAKIVMHLECDECGTHMTEMSDGTPGPGAPALWVATCENCGEPLEVSQDDINDAQHELLVALGEA